MTRGHDNSNIGSATDPEWTLAMRDAVSDARQLARDLQRVTEHAVHATMAGLAQHLANGCPPPAHRQAGLGLCRHKVWRVEGFTQAGQPIRIKQDCGNVLPCPNHPQDVELTTVEAEALRRMDTDHRIAEVALHAAQARMAVARLYGSILASERLHGSGQHEAVERCCGGWGDTQDATCTAGVVHVAYRGGVPYACCDRCYQRASKAERRAGAA